MPELSQQTPQERLFSLSDGGSLERKVKREEIYSNNTERRDFDIAEQNELK